MKKLSKILVLVLTLSLLLGMLAVFASAEDAYVAKIGDQEYATLEAAWAAALESADAEVEIDLIADVTLSTALTNAENKKIVLDLNDYTLKTAVGAATSDDAPVNAQPNGAFYLKAEGAALAIKNGSLDVKSGLIVTGETASGTPDSYLTTVELDNLYITRSTPIASDLFLALTKTVFNFNRVDVYIPTAGRLMKPFGAVQNNFTDCNFIVYSHMIHNYTPLATVKAEKDFMDWNFTNCRFVSTTEKASDNATIVFRNEARSINATDTELYTYDPETKVVTSLLPDTNFYNCEIFATPNGKQLIYNFGARNWHFYGGHYGIHASNVFAHATTSTAYYQQISVVELHKYKGEYPTFDLKKPDTNVIAKGLYDAKVTVTLDDSNAPTGFSAISENKTGAFYQTEDGYVFIPDGDEALASIKEGVIAANWRGMLRNKTFNLKTTGGSTDATTAGFYFYMPKPSSGSGTIINTTKADVNGDIYGLYQWTVVSSIKTNAMYDNWFLNGTSNLKNGTATHNKVSDVDYVTFEIDMKRPDDGTLTQLSGDGLALHLYDTASKVTKNILTNAQYKALLDDGKWHNLTVVVDSTNDTANTAYVYTDGELLKTVALTMPADATKAAFSHLAWNWATGSKTVGEGLCRDNWKVTFYGFNTTTAYAGFTGLATAAKLTDLAEYADFKVKPTYVASVGDNYYTSYADAYAAAEAGDRIELYAGVEGEQTIEKAIVVDTNGYAFSYNPVCEYKIGRHGTGNNVVTFAEADASEKITVTWQNEDGETLKTVTAVKSNLPAEYDFTVLAPEVPVEYDYDAVNDQVVCSAVWGLLDSSTENDLVYAPSREVIDALFVILNTETGAYISHGTEFGNFVTAVNRPSTSVATTLKLLDDLDFTRDEYIEVKGAHKPFTLDLNGHTFDDQNVTRYDAATASKKNRGVFKLLGTGGAVFNVTSTKPGAKIIHTRGTVATTGDQFIWATVLSDNTNSGITVNIDGGITYLGARFVSPDIADVTINIKDVTMIQTGSDGQAFFQLYGENAKLNVTDSKLYSAGTSDATNVLAGNTDTATATFDNCELLSLENTKPFFEPSATNGILGTVTFNDCKVFANIAPFEGTGTKVVLAGNTIVNSSDLTGVTVEDGRTLTALDAAGVKTGSKYSDFAFGTADEGYEFKYTKTDNVKYTFTHTTMKDADLAKIEWTLGGEVKATTKYIPGLEEQTYTRTGRILEGFVINVYEASKTAALEAGTVQAAFELAKTETYIDGLMYNLNLDSSMSINLAIPKAAYDAAGFTVTDGTNPLVGTPTVIDEADYYLVTLNSIDAISTTKEKTFVLKMGDAEAQTVTLSVAGYAAQLLENGATDVEKELARAILQYALDAEKSLDKDDADAIAELTTLLGTKVDTGVKNDGFGTVHNTDGLKATDLYGAFLRLDNNPGIVFQADEGKTVTFTVTYGSVTKTMEITKAGGEVVLDLKVYNFDTELTVNVGGVDYSYNLATYLTGLCDLAEAESAEDVLNEALANSIYNLVKAAQAYRAQ